MKSKRKRISNLHAALIILAAGAVLEGGLLIYGHQKKPAEAEEETITRTTATAEPSSTPASDRCMTDAQVLALHDEYKEDHELNQDVQGVLCFASGLIHQPVVQGTDNETYMRTDWETMEYSEYGSIFMDCRNDLSADEENTIIYGHYVYESYNSDRSLVFTPLAQLREEKNYEANKELVLVTASDVRYYEIYAVYDCPLETYGDYQVTVEELQYNLVSYDPDYFTTYLNAVKDAEFYDTGEKDPTVDDHLLSLQTCIEGNDDARQIVLCRETERRDISELSE